MNIFVRVLLITPFMGCLLSKLDSNVTWTTASEQCRAKNDTLVVLEDFGNSTSFPHGELLTWSAMRAFTPWIVYKGCYRMSTLNNYNSINKTKLRRNNVGNCYWNCKAYMSKLNICGHSSDFHFGLQMNECLCYCKNPDVQNLADSTMCNISCSLQSFEDGECGGQLHFSAYAVYERKERHLAGDCLVCYNKSRIAVEEVNCNKTAIGLCVSTNSISGSQIVEGNMSSYWKSCKDKHMFITGNTTIVCQNTSTWTGIRKYLIGSICNGIVVENQKMVYKRINCSDDLPYICKRDIVKTQETTTKTGINQQELSTNPISTNPSSISVQGKQRTSKSKLKTQETTTKTGTDQQELSTNPISTKPTSISVQGQQRTLKSKSTIAIIVGVSIVIITVSVVVFLVWYLRKQRKSEPPKSYGDQYQRRINAVNNTTYDDVEPCSGADRKQNNVIYTNTSPTSMYDILEKVSRNEDDIYMEKGDGDYDHLHSSRPKQIASGLEEERYGTANHWEDSYSSLQLNRKDEPNLNNEYHCMVIYSDKSCSYVNKSDDRHCHQADGL